MKIDDRLLSLFSGQVEQRDESYVIEIPEQELRLGNVDQEGSYQVALLPGPTTADEETERTSHSESGSMEPPVEEGQTRTVEIESIGEQGDGISRVERGYVVIVPDTEKGERVRIEINQAKENVAFADVVERLDYYE